jgi:two-component system NtrC family sensor kinase
LQRITLAAVQVTEGDYGTEVGLRKSNDEIGLLAASFNDMSRKMASDIESLRELNEKLARADRLAAMGTLAAGVAHEVNNPLASVSSLVQMLRARNDGNTEEFDLILEQIKRITQVTRDLTDFARARPAARTSVELNAVIESSVRLASFDKSFQKLDIRRGLSESLPSVTADADQLQQVFLNLFLNARDAMPDGGTLSIITASSDADVVVEIADTGNGIEKALSKQVFDPFFTTKPPGRGTGLGLSVCYGIIAAHDGRIDVRSSADGTIFTVRLPAAKGGPASKPNLS